MTTSPAAVSTLEDIRPAVDAAGQGHLLAFADELSPDEKRDFARQLGAVDWAAMPGVIRRYRDAGAAESLGDLQPPVVCCVNGTAGDHAVDGEAARAAGLEMIKAGKVAALTVAGGQGTRLGFDGPKGTLPIGPASGRTLFEVFADQIAAASSWAGRPIPWLIMTSPQNHEQTRTFFEERGWLGLDRGQIRFFQQGVMPSFCPKTGKLLLAGKSELATNPDGHGGVVRALVVSGELDRLQDEGVEHLSYFQVDNPLVPPLDPVFLGAHAGAGGAVSSGEFSSKMVAKANAAEKVGVFARAGGRTRVVEYSDLPADLAGAADASGKLRFEAGSVAIHAASLAFLRSIDEAGEAALPFHRAFKKVPHIDVASGQAVEPAEPNAVKLERFVFDAIPVAERSLVLRVDREREFAPTKNPTGVDSVESARHMQSKRAQGWLRERGHEAPSGCTLELSGLAAWADAAGLDYAPTTKPQDGKSVVL
jgi:UDP-N-acetylglucosamine/UDP-N-acetylgalactosamine diphosphorylase